MSVANCLPISIYFGSKGVPIELQRTSTYYREINISIINSTCFRKLVSCTRLSAKAYLIAHISHNLTLISNTKQKDYGCSKYKDAYMIVMWYLPINTINKAKHEAGKQPAVLSTRASQSDNIH